jgi:uncharacterized protein (DUF952 family)
MEPAEGINEIIHITTKAAWAEAKEKGELTAPSLLTEGFIHCSTKETLEETLNIHYKGKKEILAIYIAPDKLKAPLKYELAPKRGTRFPHIFGPINVDAVVKVEEM